MKRATSLKKLLLLFIADGPSYILVQRTLAGPIAHLSANTSPLPQARTYVEHMFFHLRPVLIAR